MIPRTIHQIWGMRDKGEMPLHFQQSEASWKRHHPDWKYMLWGPETVEQLIREHYPDFSDLYRRYPEWIQRADVARYLILHHHGGIYSDLDIICRRPFDELLDHKGILARTAPLGVSNDLMAAEQESTLFEQVIKSLEPQFDRWQHWYVPRHFRILLTTGSLFLTRVFGTFTDQKTIHVLTPELYGNGTCQNPLVTHIPGNSWAEWDTYVFVFLHRYWRWILGFGAFIAVIALKGV
jgi:inositol phosphorylceramide mannosyltransferase catalytic subunit